MSKIDSEYMVQQLIKARKDLQLTPYELALKMGMTVSPYYYLEGGKTKQPSERTMRKILDFYKKPPDC